MFVPTITVDELTLQRIQAGDIVLTPGQWIQLTWLDHKSRFVGVTPTAQTFWGIHSNENAKFKIMRDQFKRLGYCKD